MSPEGGGAWGYRVNHIKDILTFLNPNLGSSPNLGFGVMNVRISTSRSRSSAGNPCSPSRARRPGQTQRTAASSSLMDTELSFLWQLDGMFTATAGADTQMLIPVVSKHSELHE